MRVRVLAAIGALWLVSLSVAAPSSHAQPAFAALVARLSEAGGDFDTDNLISNERSYLQVAPALGGVVEAELSPRVPRRLRAWSPYRVWVHGRCPEVLCGGVPEPGAGSGEVELLKTAALLSPVGGDRAGPQVGAAGVRRGRAGVQQ